MQLFTNYLDSPLGKIEVSATETSLIRLYFVGAEKRPSSGCIETASSDPILACKEQLNAYFKGERQTFDLPIAFVTGTKFQQKVWMGLQKIDFGETISYLEMARRLGNEKCIRAAGVANGNNPLSIILPCHRVIGSDGKLVGYGGDLWRKEWLLKHEMKFMKKNEWQLF